MSAEFETLLKNYDRYLKDADLYEEFEPIKEFGHRFQETEDGKLPCPLNPIIASSIADLGRVTERIMTKQGSAPYKIAEAFKRECEQFGLSLPDDFVKVPEYEQMNLSLG